MAGTVGAVVHVRRPGRALAGLALGVLTAVAGLVFLLLACPFLAHPRTQRHVLAAAVRLADAEVARLRLLGGVEVSGYDGRRALRYLLWRGPVGALGCLVLVLLGAGIVTGAQPAW